MGNMGNIWPLGRFYTACSSWNYLYGEKEKGCVMTGKFTQVNTDLFMPFCPARGFNKTNISLYTLARREQNSHLFWLCLSMTPSWKHWLVLFSLLADLLITSSKMSVLHWRLLNALNSGIAWLWLCGCMLPCSGARFVVWWQNHYFMYMVTFFLFRVMEGGGEQSGSSAEVLQEGDFIPWNGGYRWCTCRCEGVLSWLWYLQDDVGHWQMDLLRPHPAKDLKISCLQKQTQNLV